VRIARCSGPDGVIGFGVIDGVDEADGITEGSTFTPIVGHPYGALELAGPPMPLAGLRLLAPTLPSKVIAVGRNYAEHAREFGNEVPEEPIIFLKPSTSVIGHGEAIVLPEQSEQVEHEAELAVVIGRLCKEVPPTTSPRATCRRSTASGAAPRASTPSARSGRGSPPTSTRPTSRSPAPSTARCVRTPARRCSCVRPTSSWRGSATS